MSEVGDYVAALSESSVNVGYFLAFLRVAFYHDPTPLCLKHKA